MSANTGAYLYLTIWLGMVVWVVALFLYDWRASRAFWREMQKRAGEKP